MENLEIERNTEDITTRLYAFGSEDMTIIHAKNDDGSEYGLPYIDSENISKYGLHEGYKDYSDYTAPEKIKAHAEWEFSAENEDRIDKPKLMISGKMIDLSKLDKYGAIEDVRLGDTVHIFDTDGEEYIERVIYITRYPFEPQATSVTIGHMTRNMSYSIYLLSKKKQELAAAQTANKSVKTRSLAGTVNTDRNRVRSGNDLLLLDGDLLTIDDETEKRRIEIGNVDGEFVFNLYDINGKQVIHFNEAGNGIFSGTIRGGKIESDTDINVNKDASVGQYLRVGYISSYTDEGGITHYEYYPNSGIVMGPGAGISSDNEGNNIEISAMGKIDLSASKVTSGGAEIATTKDLSSMETSLKKWVNENFQSKTE